MTLGVIFEALLLEPELVLTLLVTAIEVTEKVFVKAANQCGEVALSVLDVVAVDLNLKSLFCSMEDLEGIAA